MEELREAAKACFRRGSPDLKEKAWDFFKSMDANGDDKVSLNEYVGFLRQRGYDWIRPDLFAELDENNDGSLDFWEVLTLYYMVKTGRGGCDKCHAVLKGLYFTCVECFDSGGDTYDLCSKCYGQPLTHPHNYFLDSHVLLQSRRRASTPGATNFYLAQTSTPPPVVVVVQAANPPSRWVDAFHALEAACAIGSVAGVCTIM